MRGLGNSCSPSSSYALMALREVGCRTIRIELQILIGDSKAENLDAQPLRAQEKETGYLLIQEGGVLYARFFSAVQLVGTFMGDMHRGHSPFRSTAPKSLTIFGLKSLVKFSFLFLLT